MKKQFSQREDEIFIRIFINNLKRDKKISPQFLKYLEKEYGSTNLEVYFRKIYKIWWNIWFSPNDKNVKMKADRIKLIRKIRDEEFPEDAFYYKGMSEYHITEIKERKRPISIKTKKDLKLLRETKEINRLIKEYKNTGDSAYLNKIGNSFRIITNTKEFIVAWILSKYSYTGKISWLFEHPPGILTSVKEFIKFMERNQISEIEPEELKKFLKKNCPVIAIQKIKIDGHDLHSEFNQSIRGFQKVGNMNFEIYNQYLEKYHFILLSEEYRFIFLK